MTNDMQQKFKYDNVDTKFVEHISTSFVFCRMTYNLGQYISDGTTDIQCDTIRRFADGVYFVGQNENAGRCFGILNTKGDMWYFEHLTDDDVNTLTQLTEQNITQNHIDLLCDILTQFGYPFAV